MAEQDRTTLDGYFNAGDIPTQSQFADLIDSFTLLSEFNPIKEGQNAGVIGYATKSDMDADTSQSDQALALVTNDPTPSNNGYYRWDDSGGSWVKRDDFYVTDPDVNDDTTSSEASTPIWSQRYLAERLGFLTKNGKRSYRASDVSSTEINAGTGSFSAANNRQNLQMSISGGDPSILFFADFGLRFSNPFEFEVDVTVNTLGAENPAFGVGVGNGTDSTVLLIRDNGQVFSYNQAGSITPIFSANDALDLSTSDVVTFKVKSNYDLDTFYVSITFNDVTITEIIEISNADRILYGLRSGGCEFEADPFTFNEAPKSLLRKSFSFPSGFSFSDFKHDIFNDGDGSYSSSIDIDRYQTPGSIYYVDIATGSDANPGTEASPFETIDQALGQSGDKVIYVKPGVYEGTDGFWNNTIGNNVSIRRWGTSGTIDSITNFTGLSWTDEGSNVYSTTLVSTSLYHVFDKSSSESWGDWLKYSEQTSQTEVQNNAGSFWLDGTTLYVRTFDDRAPDSDVIAVVSSTNSSFTDIDGTFYCEHVNFYGGQEGFEITGNNLSSGRAQRAYLNNCTFKYAANNGLDFDSGGLVVLKSCQASSNELDGFNYHDEPSSGTSATNPPRFYEEDCIGIHNGYTGTDVNNGSTLHDVGTGIRINGQYYNNEGRNVHDINDAASLNLNCQAYNSQAASGDANADFGAGIGTDATEMWIVECLTKDSDLNLYNHTGTTINVRSLRSDSETINDGVIARISGTETGTIQSF